MFKLKKKEKEKSLNLQEIKLDISIKDFIDYLESHVLLVVLTILIMFLFHGYLLFSNSIFIDTDLFLQYPSMNYNWFDIGRFGLIVEKYILGMFSFSMYYAQILFFIFAIAFNLISYYVFYKLSGKDKNIANLILPIVIFSSPIWAEQLMFFIQMAQIAFSFTVLALSILWMYKWCLDRNIFYLIISMVGMVLIFGSYQAFLVVYIMYCIFAFLLVIDNEAISRNINIYILCAKLIVTFFIAFLLYQGICEIIGTNFEYLDASNSWKWGDFERTKELIKDHIIKILKGEGVFYSRFFTPVLALFLILSIYKTITNKSLKNKLERVFYFLACIAMTITPFLLTIYCGLEPAVRSQIYIPIFEGLLVFLLLISVNNKILKYGIVLLAYVISARQLYYLESLYYADNLRYEHDVIFIEQLEQTLRENNVPYGSKVVIIGHKPKQLNATCIEGEMVSVPLATINRYTSPYYYWSSTSVISFLRNRGYYYSGVNQADFDACLRYSENMDKTWPEEDCIEFYHGCYIIKISNDELMLEIYDQYKH